MKRIFLTQLLCMFFLFGFFNSKAQWQQTSGPGYGGIGYMTSNGSDIFATTKHNGIYHSSDNGLNWSSKSNGLIINNYSSIRTIAILGEYMFAGTYGHGIFLSTDEGQSWIALNNELTYSTVQSLVVSGNNIFAGTLDGGIYLSADYGQSWVLVNYEVANNGGIVCLTVRENDIFAGTLRGGIILSLDNGQSWSWLNNGLLNTRYINVSSIAFNDNYIFAGRNGYGVFVSSDNGQNWLESNNGLANLNVISLVVQDNNIFAGTYTDGIFLSTNNGQSWVPVNTGLPEFSYILSFLVNENNIFAGTDGNGVFRSTNNGQNWSYFNTGLVESEVPSLTVNGNNIFAISNGRLSLTSNNGQNWLPVDFNTGKRGIYINSLIVDGNNIFAGTYSGGIFLSMDNGKSWVPVNNGLTNLDVTSIVSSGNNIFAGTFGNGVFLSIDYGQKWVPVNNGLSNLDVSSLVVNGNNIFAVTKINGIFLSTNNGLSWSPINNGLPELSQVRLLAVNENNLFAICDGLFCSTDYGQNWSSINTGLPEPLNGTSLGFKGNNIFVGTEDGIFLSTNNGHDWSSVNTGLKNRRVLSLVIKGDSIFAGTFSAGVWARPLNEMISLPKIYPKITLNTSVISTGQYISIVGKDFKPSGTAKITINGNDGFTITENNISTDGQGSFNYNLATTTTMPSGIYSVIATDNISGQTAPVAQFYLKSTTTLTSNLTISSPIKTITINTNEKLLVEWKDLLLLGKNYPVTGSKRNYKYTIELSGDNGSTWETLETIEGQEYIDSRVDLNYSATISDPGNAYVIRVTDFYNSANTQKTPVITVNNVTQSGNLKADLTWDFSFPQPSVPVEGVAAEGTARIFLNLSKINSNLGPAISSVKVTLSDDFNGYDPALHGKVKVATQTSAYSSEANDIKAITATDNTPGKSNYIFWYVAPDDFAGADPEDVRSSSRFVTAKFIVNYTNGTYETFPKPIRIVRPPLMLVHGLAGAPSSWKNFRHNELGYEMKFLDDYRFNTKIPIEMYPDASFKTNAFALTIGYSNPGINSFQGIISDLRKKGYAANRVDYVGHSMGGSVLRSIYDNYYAYFTRTGNAVNRPFKNYEKGYVNKVILIGTPHNGSPLADIVNRYVGDLPLLARTTVQSWYGFSGIDNIPIPLMFMQPEDIKSFIWNYKATDAVRDLQIDNNQGGVNFGITNTRAHLISGDFFPGTQLNTNGIIPQEIINIVKNTGGEELQNLLNWFLKIACVRETDPVLKQQLLNILKSKADPVEKALAFFDKMALVLDAFNIGTFLPESDFVVSVGSQLAGYQKPTTNGTSNVSTFDDFVGHAYFRAELKNLDIGNRVNYLLNRPTNSSSFNIIPPTTENTILKSNKNILADDIIISKSDTNKLQLILPENNSTAYVDSSFQVQFTIKDTTNLKSVELRFQNKTYYLDTIYLGTTNMDIQINSSLLDSQIIVLEGYYLYADSALFVYDMININIVTKDTLNGFGVNPNILFLYSNQIKQPEYYALYKNSVTTGNFSLYISADVNDTSVVKFDYKLKEFKGIDPGETYATISYEGYSDTLYFVVYESNIDSTLVGVNETEISADYEHSQNVLLYPNPFKTNTTLEINEDKSQTSNYWILRIFDMMGNKVREMQFSSTTYIINRDELAPGLYFYRVSGNTGIVGSGKLMIVD